MTALLEASGLLLPGRLQSTSLTLAAGELVALIGPNGGGKTSLLQSLVGAEGSSGDIMVEGKRLPAMSARRARLIGYMSSSRELGWDIPVTDVVALGTGILEPGRLEELLDLFELTALAQRPVTRLSTGERSRVLMARAIASSPVVLLLDEPLSNLDPYWVLRFLDLMRRRAADGGAVLCALHDLSLLERFDRALLVSDGAIRADEPASFIGSHPAFAESFRLRATRDGGWEIRPPEDRRSSP